jgi:hypothetical protein
MRLFRASLGVYFMMVAAALAATPEAREVARINNCTPKKIEVLQQTLGIEGKTIYRVECNLPQAKNENAIKTADALLVQCEGSLCALLRPVENSK